MPWGGAIGERMWLEYVVPYVQANEKRDASRKMLYDRFRYVVIARIVMARIVMACIAMAYLVMAYIVMACIAMAYVMPYDRFSALAAAAADVDAAVKVLNREVFSYGLILWPTYLCPTYLWPI